MVNQLKVHEARMRKMEEMTEVFICGARGGVQNRGEAQSEGRGEQTESNHQGTETAIPIGAVDKWRKLEIPCCRVRKHMAG